MWIEEKCFFVAQEALASESTEVLAKMQVPEAFLPKVRLSRQGALEFK